MSDHENTTFAQRIDTLSHTAKESEGDIKVTAWRELWRIVLPLERWFFIKDESETLSPIFLKDGDNVILPIFTDAARATQFADDFGGPDRVYASAPGSMLTAARQLTKNGVTLCVFNPQNEPFAVSPATLEQLAEGYISSGEGQIVGVQGNTPESQIDVLADFARKNPDDIKARGALWIHALLLDSWYLVPRGEGEAMQPFAVTGPDGPILMAFTEAKRAAEYATLRGLGDLDAVIAMTPTEIVEVFTRDSSVVTAVHIDPQHGSFFTQVDQLPQMLKIANDVAANQPDAEGV
ncbi:hypothetical protein [Jonesia denitrificans]|uniref:SseB protein N-terminal domain-containing protein n=1 Tax=Jonesia denitrificans (strain ATCC 14870 / DSM 20603 / BCRC 15368 / CIP 55.134 / JCM 11481 / NBRC 15587 / NCTC 10816 / Prevot 55134) TaxID=471856 RepID=C7R1N3_JONDD|nr:hypothetical protein [Jonesia denitrificans]ACV09868.1 hypothetical protein Jden_2231 [Jonesia denitrificans DSM 20603]ASE08939.1 hypothetical protein CEP80_07160 [Jonesia denitrificans]QXB43485.1 hypothetical protein I6L70_00820 [Jonesia denitrificans]SQH22548.1 Uncharacterised protein [Jonesia denitrificans]